jgi:heterodisulfide reductase subunit A-like polyferredoxin
MKVRQKEQRKLSRRAFVRGAGIGTAAIAGTISLPALKAEVQKSATSSAIPEEWDLEAEVVVIGSGATGFPAAIRAADEGATVLVVETNHDIGGHGLING